MQRLGTLHVVALLLAVSAPLASAQDPLAEGMQRRVGCLPRASRAQESCDPEQVVVKIEQQLEFAIEVPAPKAVQCVATIEVVYTQRNTAAGVEGTIANSDCAASSGDYKMVVSIRNAEGAVQSLEFLESWQREDDQPVKFSAAYPIGENVDLLRVRPAQSRCTCGAVPAVP